MKNVLKKLLHLSILPFVLLYRVISWPFRKRKFVSKPELSIIEKMAETLHEGIPYREEPRLRGGSFSLYKYGIDYEEYKKANSKCVSIRSWSFAPMLPGFPVHTRKIMNSWRWRMGKWRRADLLNKSAATISPITND